MNVALWLGAQRPVSVVGDGALWSKEQSCLAEEGFDRVAPVELGLVVGRTRAFCWPKVRLSVAGRGSWWAEPHLSRVVGSAPRLLVLSEHTCHSKLAIRRSKLDLEPWHAERAGLLE